MEDPVRHTRSVAKHRAIADAIAHRDTDAARTAMEAVVTEGITMARAKRS